jgi:hypothetical protein
VPKIDDHLDTNPELKIQAGIAALVFDFKLSMAKRIEIMVKYLKTETCDFLTRTYEHSKAEKHAAFKATELSLLADERIALAKTAYRKTTALGYCLAPVVIAKISNSVSKVLNSTSNTLSASTKQAM